MTKPAAVPGPRFAGVEVPRPRIDTIEVQVGQVVVRHAEGDWRFTIDEVRVKLRKLCPEFQ